jgi:soluble lytic murein transglycosylase
MSTSFRFLSQISIESFLRCIAAIFVLGLAQLHAQTARETQFEKLSQSYREQNSAATKTALVSFCQQNAGTPQSSLGYFLLGYKELEAGRFQQAEEFFAKSIHRSPLQDYVLYHWAASLNGLNRHTEVVQRLRKFSSRFPNSPWIEKAQSLFWQSALEMKDAQGVLDSLASSGNLEDNPEALFYKAQAYELLGDGAKALSIYQRLHYLFPLYSNGTLVFQKLSQLLSSGMTISSEPTKEWKISRIEKLFSGRRYRDTLTDLESLFQTDSASVQNPRLQLWRGISLFGTGQYGRAIEALKNLPRASPEVSAQAQFTVAECYRKLDDYPQFSQTVNDMSQTFARSRWSEEALFSIGNYNLVRRNLDESMSFYKAILEQFPEGSRAEDCHWRVAWNEYRQGRYPQALDLFIDHLSRFKQSDHRAAALYWTGRVQERLGQVSQAQEAYQVVLRKFPTLYYGQLAQKQLNAMSSAAKASYQTDSRLEAVLRRWTEGTGKDPAVNLAALRNVSLENWPRVKLLASAQLFGMAAYELLRPEVYGSSRPINFQAAQLFYREQDFYQTTLRLRRVFPNYLELPFDALPAEVWKMFYPVNYASAIFREAEKYQVDPFLVMSLIRQESAFNPRAVSPANAHGLMQVLPSTARRLARAMRLPRPSAEDLHDPDLNVQLGMRYLADLLKRFGGEEDKALAGYNAGEHRVESWIGEGNYDDSAEFVDTIPFSETRNYVKIIYRNYFFYKKLYGNRVPASNQGSKVRHDSSGG